MYKNCQYLQKSFVFTRRSVGIELWKHCSSKTFNKRFFLNWRNCRQCPTILPRNLWSNTLIGETLIYIIQYSIDKLYRKRGRGQCVFIENWTNYDHKGTCFVYGGVVMPGRRAGSGVSKYNAESPKQGSKRFNSIRKTIHFAHLGKLFIYIYGVSIQLHLKQLLHA